MNLLKAKKQMQHFPIKFYISNNPGNPINIHSRSRPSVQLLVPWHANCVPLVIKNLVAKRETRSGTVPSLHSYTLGTQHFTKSTAFLIKTCCWIVSFAIMCIQDFRFSLFYRVPIHFLWIISRNSRLRKQ